MADCVNTLKEWTGKTHAAIIYDSTVDEFTDDGLFKKIFNRWDVAIIGFTTEGDVFGGFYTVAVTFQDQEFSDPNQFAFSFESHGRCETPKECAVREKLREDVCVFTEDSVNRFVSFTVDNHGDVFLGNGGSNSFCKNVSGL